MAMAIFAAMHDLELAGLEQHPQALGTMVEIVSNDDPHLCVISEGLGHWYQISRYADLDAYMHYVADSATWTAETYPAAVRLATAMLKPYAQGV